MTEEQENLPSAEELYEKYFPGEEKIFNSQEEVEFVKEDEESEVQEEDNADVEEVNPESTDVQEEAPEEAEAEEISESNEEAVQDDDADIKSFKFLAGESEIAVPQDAIITVTTKKGQEAKVSLQDLSNDYWGKSEVNRRINDVQSTIDNYIKPHQEKIEEFSSLLKNIEQKTKDGDVMGAFEEIHKKIATQLPNGDEALRAYYSSINAEYHKLSGMTEEQRSAYVLEQENTRLRTEQANQRNSEAQTQTNEIISTRLSTIEETTGLQRADLTSVFNYLKESGTIADTTPIDQALDALEQTAYQLKLSNQALDILGKVDEQLKSPEGSLIKDDDIALEYLMMYQSKKPELSADEVLEHAMDMYGSKKVTKANNRARKHEKATGQKVSNKPKAKSTGKSVKQDPNNIDLGRIEDEFREQLKGFGNIFN